MDCARAVLGAAGGANILLYPPWTLGIVRDGRNLLTQQVTHSSPAATLNPHPKKTASQAAAPAKLRVLPALQWGHGEALQGQQRWLCDTGVPLCPQSSRTVGFAESPLTPVTTTARRETSEA